MKISEQDVLIVVDVQKARQRSVSAWVPRSRSSAHGARTAEQLTRRFDA
jgi:hypothetical protein